MRAHGLLLYNFCRYGETDNIVELSKGSSVFFEHGDDVSKWLTSEVAILGKEKLSEWDSMPPRVISIVGQTDGDGKRSNGTGKSTIMEGMVYATHGKLIRDFINKSSTDGSSTSSIIPDQRKVSQAYVEFLFSAEGELWLLKRGRKVSKSGDSSAILELRCITNSSRNLECSGHRGEDTKKYIIDLIKMDFDSCCNSVLFGQNDSGRFLTGTDGERKEILVNILQLQNITKYLEEIRKVRKKKCNEDISSFSAQINLLEYQVKEIGTGDDIRANIKKINTKISELELSISDVDEVIKQLQSSPENQNHTALKEKVRLTEQFLKGISEKYASEQSSLKKSIEDNQKRLSDINTSISSSERLIANIVKKIADSDKIVLGFNEDSYKKDSDLTEKAKAAKPVRQEELKKLQEQIDKKLLDENTCLANINSFKVQMGGLTDILQGANSAEATTKCPECESVVPIEHITSKIKEKQIQIDKCEKESAAISTERKVIESQKLDIEKRLANIEKQIEKSVDLLLQFQRFEAEKKNKSQLKIDEKEALGVLSGLKTKIPDVQKSIDESTLRLGNLQQSQEKESEKEKLKLKELNDELTKSEEAKAAHDKKVNDANARKSKIQLEKDSAITEKAKLESKAADALEKSKSIESLNSRLSESKKIISRLEYLEWVFGPKGIQTQLIYRYIPLLNKYISEYAGFISDIGLEVNADLGETDKLTFSVSGDTSSRLEGLSGGEGAKIHLAVNIALGLLSFVRRKDIPEFICFDEVFSPVDASTRELIFDMITHLQLKFKDIIIISHDPAILEKIKDTIIVNKVNGVSRIVRT